MTAEGQDLVMMSAACCPCAFDQPARRSSCARNAVDEAGIALVRDNDDGGLQGHDDAAR